MTPDQLIYDYLFELSLNAGYTTYDHLPLESENVQYPFVVIGAVQTIPITTKNAVYGQITVNIDVWGNAESRFEISKIMNDIFVQAMQPACIQSYSVRLRIDRSDNQIIQDMSVPNTILNHGMLTLIFNIN